MQQAPNGLTVIIITNWDFNFHSAAGWGKTGFDTVHINEETCGPYVIT